ncbi:MAG: hypothetical protein AB4057_05805 [Crocosphaera sp.]
MENSSQPTKLSTLEQLRQRRQSPGLINTESLHCHYQGIQGTSRRLIQRSALPSKIQFRYGTQGRHPVALVHRLYQRRRISTDSVEQRNHQSFPNPYRTTSPLIQTPQNPPSPQLQNKPQPTSIKTQSSKALTSSPQSFTNSTTLNPQDQYLVTPPKPMQINHQKTLTLVNQKSSEIPITLQTQPINHPNPSLSPSVSPHKPSSSPLSDSNPTNPTLSSFRVRQPVSLADANLRPLQGTTSQSIQPKKILHSSNPNPSEALPLVQRKVEVKTSQSRKMSSSPLSPKPERISQKTNQGESLKASVSPLKVQTSVLLKANPLQPKNLTLSSTEPFTNVTAASPTSNQSFTNFTAASPTSNQSFTNVTAASPTSNQSLSSTLRQTSTVSKPDHLQRLPLTTPSSSTISRKDPSQANVSTSLTISSQRQTTSPYQSTLELPLAITHSKTTNSIARQPMLNGSSSSTTRQTTTTQSMSVSEPTTNLIDIAKVAQQVSRILGRQLQVEQERRGYKR